MKFTSIKSVIVLGLAFFSSTAAFGNSPTYLFEIFLENKLNSFPEWIRSNNLDPSPVNPSEITLFISNLIPRYTFKIKNEQIAGYSSASNNLSISAQVDRKRQFFHVSYSTKGSLKFQGHYSINGTNLYPERPLIGDGTWTYDINGTLTENFTYRFKIKPNGYLDISRDIKEYTAFLIGDTDEKDVKLFGYLEDEADLIEYEKYTIKLKFQKAFDDQRIQNSYPEHPTAALMHQFLIDVFQTTHYSEIINDQLNPITSSSTTEIPRSELPTNPSTTEESTTNHPTSPTDETLNSQSSNFKLSFVIYLVTMISLLYF